MSQILSYNSDKVLKKDLLKEVKKHEKADQIVKGHYGKMNGKWTGCAVGCSIHSLNLIRGKDYPTDQHSVYETEFGIPRIIARLQDGIFEHLPMDRAKKFPFEFLSAVPIGKDLTPVWKKFLVWLLVDKKEGVIKFAKKEQTKKAIQDVADLIQRSLTEKITPEQFAAVRKAAYEARSAAAAAYAAAYAAGTAAAAYAAAAAAAYAAYAGTGTGTAAAAAYATRTKRYVVMADKLIELGGLPEESLGRRVYKRQQDSGKDHNPFYQKII